MDNLTHKLAVIIPAYKGVFLKETLDSLCEQTDKRFRVYVGDDCSPDDLEQLCENYKNSLNINYKRFSNNLGETSLVQHWNRCVKLSNEAWCWLLCDDDIINSHCVEIFYSTLEQINQKFYVYRFNTSIIDTQGNILKDNPDHPEVESGIDFAIYRFRGKRSSFVSEYIFARQSFDSEDGFVDFPLAWCSDDASWISFSKNHGIYTIKGPRVLWRYSGLNISTTGNKYQKQKIDSAIKYIKWLDRQIARNKLVIKNKDDIKLLKIISREWLYNQFFFVAPLGITRYYNVSRLIHEIFDKSNFKDILRLFMVDFKFYMSRFKNILIKNRPRFLL